MALINTILNELPPICLNDFQKKIEIFNKISTLANVWKLKAYLFGSLSFGVYTKDCDLDILCVGTKSFTSVLFFKSFFIYLNNYFKDCWVIDMAKVPIIKIFVDGHSVDLSFISMDFFEFPINFNIYYCDFNFSLSNKSNVIGLCGVRVSKQVLNLIPDINKFRVLMYVIKYWAKINGVYSNVLGFLGGISWTIMVAYICRKYPQCNEYQLLQHFFSTFSSWNWSESISLYENESVINSVIPMSIFTPVKPYQNTALNVLISSKDVIEKKLKIANHLLSDNNVKRMFMEDVFFVYDSYFSIIIKCGHNFWFNLVESKIRNFVHFIEQQKITVDIHINTKIYSKNDIKCVFIGLNLKDGFKLVDLREYMQNFKSGIYSLSKCKSLSCCNFNIEYVNRRSEKMYKILSMFAIKI